MNTVSIKGLDKVKLLAALYNHAKPQGMGYLHYNPVPMTVTEAEEIFATGQRYFDYLKGRVMKVDLSGEDLSVGLYDRDNGSGSAERVVSTLRQEVK